MTARTDEHPTTTEPTPRAVLRSLLLPIMLPTLLYATGTAAIVPVIPLVGLRLGLSVAQVAVLTTVIGVVAVVSPVPLGQGMARIGERRGLVIGGSLAVLALLGCLWAAGQPQASRPGTAALVLVISLVVLAFGDETWDLGRQTYLADHVPHAARARVMTTFGGVLRIGRVLGPAVGALVLSLADLEAVFVVHLVAALLSIVSVLVFVAPAARRDPTAAPPEPPTAEERRAIVRPFVLVGLGVMVVAAVRTNRDLLIPLLGHAFGHDAKIISLTFAVAAAVEIALVLPAGSIMQRYGRLAVLLPCLFGTGIAFLLSPLGSSVPGFLAVAVVLALGNGLGAGINKTLSADLTPPRNRAAWMGWWNALVGAGSLIGPGLVAILTPLVSVVGAGVATGVLALIGGVWTRHWGVRYLPRPERRDRS
ncbi:MFS family permease [Friedmanniella endophytica]|uniref:MFS family permease n=1 Tax=Microlunatus kandeliicorticis TaxID=1759536 RepID=A0A7W3P4N0_9ACTN|nr:MFS transporter [Microlunatus kandeliicorticis]MBA8793064.1 MFS family permease [Microlunatus kandeliicorticis]